MGCAKYGISPCCEVRYAFIIIINVYAHIERKTSLIEERQEGITQYEDIYERIQPGDEEAVKEERRLL